LVLVLVLQVWCCFVKHDLVTVVDIIIMILKDAATFQVLFSYSFSILCFERHTWEISSGVHLLKS